MLLLDSCASQRMTCRLDWLHDVVDLCEKPVLLGNNTATKASHEGKMRLFAIEGTRTAESNIMLKKVLYIPSLRTNLISCRMLCKDGYSSTFEGETCEVRKDKVVMLTVDVMDEVYCLNTEAVLHNITELPNKVKKIQLWHDRLGHADVGSITELLKTESVIGLKRAVTTNC